MQFTHIHCSSRFSRSPATLETAVDRWRTQASVITLTEVSEDRRARTLAEQGWGYYNATAGGGPDQCATTWNLDVWVCKLKQVYKLIGRWPSVIGHTLWAVYCNTVVLQHKTSGHKVLFSTIHTPNKVGGPSGFTTAHGYHAAQRIADYKRMIVNWANYIAKIARTQKPDAIVVSADFNINFRAKWVQRYVREAFNKTGMQIAWKHFTSKGTYGHAVIDASLYKGLSTEGSVVIPDVADSTDHTPFKTTYSTITKPGTPVVTPTKPGGGTSGGGGEDDPTGQTGDGVAWWNFDDFGDDTVYELEVI